MRIEYLKYFYKVAQAKYISKVAKQEHISQSALSQQISRLEEILGCTLLERSNKGVELTEKGAIVFKYAENIIRTYEAMLEQLEEESERSLNIKIEACWPIATYSLPCVMYKITKKFPKNNYILNVNDADKIEENVLNNICELGVIYEKPKNEELYYHKIGSDKLVLVAAYNYKINDEISLDDLGKHPLIILNDNIELKKLLIEKMEGKGKKLNILYNSDSPESVKSSVMNEFGIGFLPYVSIKKDLYRKQLKLIEISDFKIEYDMYIIYEKSITEDKMLNEFLQYLKDTAQKNLC